MSKTMHALFNRNSSTVTVNNFPKKYLFYDLLMRYDNGFNLRNAQYLLWYGDALTWKIPQRGLNKNSVTLCSLMVLYFPIQSTKFILLLCSALLKSHILYHFYVERTKFNF